MNNISKQTSPKYKLLFIKVHYYQNLKLHRLIFLKAYDLTIAYMQILPDSLLCHVQMSNHIYSLH